MEVELASPPQAMLPQTALFNYLRPLLPRPESILGNE
jgi:hypothetical protein